jgi:uncharacterized repeat protein (TIGR01451 family)
MQTGRSWHRLPLPNVVAAFLLSAFIVGYVAPAALAAPSGNDDFEVLIAANPAGAVNVGATVTYTVTVNRGGPGSTPPGDVTVGVGAAPVGLTLGNASITAGTGNCTGSSCNLTAVPDGGSSTISITGTANAPGAYTVTATLTAPNPADPTPGNDVASIPTTVNPAADLVLTKSAAPTTAYVGQDVTFTLTTTNNGPSASTNVTVVDTLPAGLTFKSSATCSATGQTVNCTPSANLANGANVVHTIVATVAPTATGSLQNSATVNSTNPGGTFDPNVANNTATATVAITAPPAELAISLADDPDPVGPGMDLEYTIAITSTGPNDAPNVAVTASVPPETTFVSADGSGTLSGSAVNWTVPSVAKNATVTLHYTVTVNTDVSAQSLSSTASLTYGGDTTPADNTATADTAVGAEADVVVAIAADDLNPGKDGAVTFSIAVGNAGPQDVSGVIVEAHLPKGIAFDAATDPSAAIAALNAYDPATGRWDPVDLVAGAAVTMTLSGTVTTANQVTVTADAILPAGFSDPTPSNATDSVILNQADTGGNGGGNGGGSGGGTGGSGGGTGGSGGTNEGTAFTGFTATQLMPWLAFFMILGLSSVEFARRRGHVLPVGSTYGFEPWMT